DRAPPRRQGAEKPDELPSPHPSSQHCCRSAFDAAVPRSGHGPALWAHFTPTSGNVQGGRWRLASFAKVVGHGMSRIGTKQPYAARLSKSALRGKADITSTAIYGR